ncbi:MAG TPA: serine protein kinase [Candidatus Paceibacterota bacterium]
MRDFISSVSNHCKETHQKVNWSGSFEDYLKIVQKSPRVARNAFQRVYDMILSQGVVEDTNRKKKVTRFKFFQDEKHGGKDAVFGIDISLMHLVDIFKSAAKSYGTEHRVILLHGPVGSAKSTIVRLLKKGLEDYSLTEDGKIYTFVWQNIGEILGNDIKEMMCPMREDPLLLIPSEKREEFLKNISTDYSLRVDGDLCPACRQMYRDLNTKYDGDWEKVIKHIKVVQFAFSERDRVGIGTFQPKDEKNQDSTELTGDINYRKIAIYGSDSDPRAFNFDGEFNVANRGIIEFVEVLKLEVAFLYDLLGASQEHKIKPKKFPQTDIDEVIIGHTNEPEYKKLQSNEFMEALRDRTVKVDVPYITILSDEIKVYEKDYNLEKIRGKHIAPHTIAMAAMWAVLTRLEIPKKANLTPLQKLKLYDGKTMPGHTADSVDELKKETVREGMDGISPRYIQDKISNALVNEQFAGCVNPFMVLNELESGLRHHSLIKSEEQRQIFRELLAVVKGEYEDVVKNEVQRAISADEEALSRLSSNYIDNVKAYTQKERVKNKYTGQDEAPDERLMRSVEEKIEIPESRKDDFRREIMNYIGALAIDGKRFDYKTNERLYKALELKLFEDRKDSIKLTSLVSNVVDKETQEKIDVVKERLKNKYGYCDICATDVLNYVASIFARGDAKS